MSPGDRIGALALVIAALVTACAAPPVAVPSPIAVAAPAPSPDVTFVAFNRLLNARDAAWRAGDADAAVALVAAGAPAAFREQERQLALLVKAGVPLLPTRGPLIATYERDRVRWEEVVETDSQGRTRGVRYFASGPLDALRLSEPGPADLGDLAVSTTDRFEVQSYAIDAEQCASALGYAEEALSALVVRLGEAYRPAGRATIVCAPTIRPELPALASAFTDGVTMTFLTSQSLIVRAGPAAAWSRTVVTHELSHVLLFARGTGPFVLLEGIPLWLTDDRRQPELDRIVAGGSFWTLAHLVAGPRDQTEFFAGYAQASSFVRFLASTYGEAKVIAAWEGGRSATFDEAFAGAFGVTPDVAYARWRASLAR